MATNTFDRKPSLIKQKRILDLLVTPLTQPEICAFLYVSEPHLRSIIREMHRKKLVYVHSYTNDAVVGQRAFLRKKWATGSMPDAVRPQTIPLVVRNKCRYEAIKADPVKSEERKRKDHHRYLLRKFKSNPDVFMNWIRKNIHKELV